MIEYKITCEPVKTPSGDIVRGVVTDNGTVIQPTFERATDGSAAYDLRAMISSKKIVRLQQSAKFPTGIAVHIGSRFVAGLALSRSGHGFKFSVRLANCVGLIDSDYQGEIMVSLHNDNKYKDFHVEPGDRIAQLVFVDLSKLDVTEVDEFSTVTGRGTNGFGSTGDK